MWGEGTRGNCDNTLELSAEDVMVTGIVGFGFGRAHNPACGVCWGAGLVEVEGTAGCSPTGSAFD